MKSLLTLALISLVGLSYSQEATPKNKAHYLFTLTNYFEWNDKEKVLGFFGNSIVKDEAEVIQKSQLDFVIRQFESENTENWDKCRLLFLPSEQSHRLDAIQSAVYGKPVLIVTDNRKLLKEGADIAFYKQGKQLKLMINKKAIEESGVEMKSKLLSYVKVYQ